MRTIPAREHNRVLKKWFCPLVWWLRCLWSQAHNPGQVRHLIESHPRDKPCELFRRGVWSSLIVPTDLPYKLENFSDRPDWKKRALSVFESLEPIRLQRPAIARL